MSRTAVLIPARGDSRGIPRKNLVDLCGKPLVFWSLAQAKAANVGPKYVISDSEEIKITVKRAMPEVWTLPEETRNGTTPMEEVIRDALAWMDSPEWLVLLQPTSPLRIADHIREALMLCAQGSADSVFSVTESHKFLWRMNPDYKEPSVVEEIGHHRRERVMRQDLYPVYAENGSIYIMRVDRFLAGGTRFCGRTVPYVMPPWTSTEIDSVEDLDMVRLILADRLRQGKNGVTS